MTATADANANEIRIVRVYDAPLGLVWDAWTDPTQVVQWWGPRGFTVTTHSRDLRAGGTWEYTMHGPDGTDWPNFTRYHEVEPRRRLVYDHGASSSDAKPLFRVTVEFREVDGKTELDLRMALDTPQAARDARVFIKAAGGNATWDRLAEYLEKTASDQEIFVINRSFDVPIETMFDLWTVPEHLSQWLPPAGFTMAFHHVDIRPGGAGFYSMTDGQFTMHGRLDYIDLHRPDRISYLQYFTDANERISRYPGAPVWPEKMLTTVLLSEEGPGATRVTVRWEVYGVATPEEVAAFVAERGGMTQGWTGSFDKLDTLIEQVNATGV